MSPRTRRTGRPRSPRRGAARAENTVSTTMRLRRPVRAGLEQAAARAQRSVSEVAQELIDEGLRMRDCPGIYFATEPAGRTAKVSGTGLGVWEVLRDFVQDEDMERLRRAFPQLSSTQIRGGARAARSRARPRPHHRVT